MLTAPVAVVVAFTVTLEPPSMVIVEAPSVVSVAVTAVVEAALAAKVPTAVRFKAFRPVQAVVSRAEELPMVEPESRLAVVMPVTAEPAGLAAIAPPVVTLNVLLPEPVIESPAVHVATPAMSAPLNVPAPV